MDDSDPPVNLRSEIPTLPSPTLEDPEEHRTGNAEVEAPVFPKQNSYRQINLTTWWSLRNVKEIATYMISLILGSAENI